MDPLLVGLFIKILIMRDEKNSSHQHMDVEQIHQVFQFHMRYLLTMKIPLILFQIGIKVGTKVTRILNGKQKMILLILYIWYGLNIGQQKSFKMNNNMQIGFWLILTL